MAALSAYYTGAVGASAPRQDTPAREPMAPRPRWSMTGSMTRSCANPNQPGSGTSECTANTKPGTRPGSGAKSSKPFSDSRALREATGLPVLGPVSMLVSAVQKRRERRRLVGFVSGFIAFLASFGAGFLLLFLHTARAAI